VSENLPRLQPAGRDPLAERRPSPGEWVLAAVFALPILGGLVIRVFIGGMWLRDLDAVTCAAWRTAHGVSPYSPGLACPIGRPTDYMYLPQLAGLLAPLGGGVLLAALAALLVLATGDGRLGDWKAALDEVALRAQPGYGFLSWMDWLGLSAAGQVVPIAFVVLAAAICLSGLAVVEIRKFDREARLFLALAVAQIVNPRPMAYDLIMLAPLVLAFGVGPAASRRIFRWGLYGLGVMETALLMAGTDLAQRLGPAALTLALLVAGGLAVRDGFDRRSSRLVDRLAGRAPIGL
jgi:hypothetical protein